MSRWPLATETTARSTPTLAELREIIARYPQAALGAAADAAPGAVRRGLRHPRRHRAAAPRSSASPPPRSPRSRRSTRCTSAARSATTTSASAPTRCARCMGGDAIFDALKDHLDVGNDETTDGRQGHPRARRVQRGLRLRAGGDGQLGVLRQPDAASRRRELVDDLRAGDEVALDPRRRRCAPWREAERCSPASPTSRADEGPAARDRPSLVGLRLAARARLDARRQPTATAGDGRHGRAAAHGQPHDHQRPRAVRTVADRTRRGPCDDVRVQQDQGATVADAADPGADRGWDEPSPGRWRPTRHRRLPGLRTALGMAPDDVIAAGQGLRPARPRRRRLPDRHEVGLHPAGRRQAALPRGQRRRVRAGHLQGHPADDGQPAHAGRGRHHRLRTRSAPTTRSSTSAARSCTSSAGCSAAVARGLRRRLPRQGHPRLRLRPRDHRARRRRRLHLRRGDRAARLARGPPRPAPAAAAVPRRRRPVRQPDRRQQRRDHRVACRRSCASGADWFTRMGTEKSPGFTIYSLSGHVDAAPASTRRRWASPCASCSTWPAACARATS